MIKNCLKVIINFGHRAALLHSAGKLIQLTLPAERIPTVLADMLQAEGEVTVNSIVGFGQCDDAPDDNSYCIQMTSRLTPGSLLKLVSETLSEIYSCDVSIGQLNRSSMVVLD